MEVLASRGNWLRGHIQEQLGKQKLANKALCSFLTRSHLLKREAASFVLGRQRPATAAASRASRDGSGSHQLGCWPVRPLVVVEPLPSMHFQLDARISITNTCIPTGPLAARPSGTCRPGRQQRRLEWGPLPLFSIRSPLLLSVPNSARSPRLHRSRSTPSQQLWDATGVTSKSARNPSRGRSRQGGGEKIKQVCLPEFGSALWRVGSGL